MTFNTMMHIPIDYEFPIPRTIHLPLIQADIPNSTEITRPNPQKIHKRPPKIQKILENTKKHGETARKHQKKGHRTRLSTATNSHSHFLPNTQPRKTHGEVAYLGTGGTQAAIREPHNKRINTTANIPEIHYDNDKTGSTSQNHIPPSKNEELQTRVTQISKEPGKLTSVWT
jgi:hypothetical protein